MFSCCPVYYHVGRNDTYRSRKTNSHYQRYRGGRLRRNGSKLLWSLTKILLLIRLHRPCANPCDIAIPTDALISIESKGDSHTIRYRWRGKELTITGKLFEGYLTGESDFGGFKLHTRTLSSLNFNQPPHSEEKQYEDSKGATITLEDGTQITAVNGLRRHVSYYSTEGYIIGGADQYLHYDDFRFLRGQSLSTVKFTAIKRLEFEDEKDVSVTLKNGKQTSGTISTEQDNNILGFTGTFTQGKFFVSKKRVKVIEFVTE